MTDTNTLLALAKITATLWHVMAFASGFAFVVLSFSALFGFRAYDRSWSRLLRTADTHLWLSGIAIIACAIALTGPEKVFANPKLWTKVLVVSVWTMTTITLRQQAARWLANASRLPIVLVSSISLATWIYGAFLGCAKEFSSGVVGFPVFVTGFIALAAVCALTGLYLESRLERSRDSRNPHQLRHGRT